MSCLQFGFGGKKKPRESRGSSVPKSGWATPIFHNEEPPSMPISDDVDPDALISRLAGPLLPADRAAFRHAAEYALRQIPCAGEGLVYRIVREVWRGYFHPPADASFAVSPERRSKLTNKPPIEYGGDGRLVRYRKHLRATG
jgi:hypothetical protein